MDFPFYFGVLSFSGVSTKMIAIWLNCCDVYLASDIKRFRILLIMKVERSLQLMPLKCLHGVCMFSMVFVTSFAFEWLSREH